MPGIVFLFPLVGLSVFGIVEGDAAVDGGGFDVVFFAGRFAIGLPH